MTATTVPNTADSAAAAGTIPSVSGTPHAAGAAGNVRSRRGMAILAALVLVGLGVGAYLLLSGDDDSKSAGNSPTEVSAEQLRSFAVSQKAPVFWRSEEHTSELQSRQYLVCRLLLEKKKKHLVTLKLLQLN